MCRAGDSGIESTCRPNITAKPETANIYPRFLLIRCTQLRTHDEHQIFRREHAAARQNIQKRVLGENRLCKINKIGNDFVVPIGPEGGERKAVAGLFGFVPVFALLFDVAAAGGVGIIFRVGVVGDHKNLDVFKQAARGPKAVALVALDLVERLADGHAAPLELDMYQRQAVDEDGHVVARVVAARRMAGRFLYRRSGSCCVFLLDKASDGKIYSQKLRRLFGESTGISSVDKGPGKTYTIGK